MSTSLAQTLAGQSGNQRPGGVATGHVPQQPNMGFGPNRYVPPTFNWGRGGLDGRQPQYTQMDWNQMQGFYMPQQQNNTFTNPYMQQLQGMLGMFSNQYGGPNRQPTLPQFSSYNPGFGGPTSFFDQSLQDWGRSAMDMQRNMGQGPQGRGEYQMYGGGGRGSDPYAAYLEYQQNNPNGTDPGFNIGGPGQRAATLSREQYSQWLRDTASGMYDNMYPDPYGRGGGMQNPEGYSDRWSLAPSEMRGGTGGQGSGGFWGNYGPEDQEFGGSIMPVRGGGGGMAGGGFGGNALPEGYSYNAPEGRSYTMEMPTNGGQWAYGPNGERIVVGGNQRGPGADFFRNLFEGGGGGMYGREYDRRAAYEHARQQPDFDWGNYGESMDGPRMPYGGNGGGFGGRGGYPMMPQFNPYMLARNNMMGMGFNEMFDPRFAMLFGMGGLGAMRPQGFASTQPQQPPSTANGQKPLAIGGGG